MSESKLYLCKYQVKSFIIMKGSEKIQMDHTNILSIEYLSDYEFKFRALLKVSLRLDVRQRLWILKNKKDITLKFELDKIGMDIDVEEYVTSPEVAWNLEFNIYFNDEDEATDVGIMEERIAMNEGEDFQSNDIESENYFESQNTIDLYLFHPKLFIASQKTFNDVHTEGTLQDIVGDILTFTKHTDILMSKFENDDIYKELLSKADPSYKSIMSLDQYHGFYRKGAVIFYDIDTLYILNSNGKVTAKRENEWTEVSILVHKLDNASPGNGMKRVEGEKIYYPNVSEMDVNPQKFSISKNAELGSSAKIVASDDVSIDIYEADQSFINQRNEKITYVKKENKFAGEIMKARMEENECVLYISAENLDLNAFRPNKTFRVIFEETSKQERYGKFEYRIAYAYHFLKAESEGFMSSSHRIVLKKTSGPVNDVTIKE